MLATKNYKFWFCTGSQDLYGDECLAHVAEHSKIIVAKLNESGVRPGFSDYRSTESRCFIYIPSSMRRSLMTPSTWIS